MHRDPTAFIVPDQQVLATAARLQQGRSGQSSLKLLRLDQIEDSRIDDRHLGNLPMHAASLQQATIALDVR
jgi:hypothetical protein